MRNRTARVGSEGDNDKAPTTSKFHFSKGKYGNVVLAWHGVLIQKAKANFPDICAQARKICGAMDVEMGNDNQRGQNTNPEIRTRVGLDSESESEEENDPNDGDHEDHGINDADDRNGNDGIDNDADDQYGNNGIDNDADDQYGNIGIDNDVDDRHGNDGINDDVDDRIGYKAKVVESLDEKNDGGEETEEIGARRSTRARGGKFSRK